MRGFETSVTSNVVRGNNAEKRLPMWLTGAGVVVLGKHFKNVELLVNDQTKTDRPILIQNNIQENTVITHTVGNLIPKP